MSNKINLINLNNNPERSQIVTQMNQDTSNERQFSESTQKQNQSSKGQYSQQKKFQSELGDQSQNGEIGQKSQNNIDSQSQIKSEKMGSQNELGNLKSAHMVNDQQPITQQQINQIKKIYAQFRDFKPERQNKLQLINVSYRVLLQVIALWKKRHIKTTNYVLTLIIDKIPQHATKQQILRIVEIFASVKLIICGQQIENKKSIHALKQNAYYQGIDNQFMMITKTSGDVVDSFEGQVKDMMQNGTGQLYHSVNSKIIWHYVGDFVDGKRQGKGKQMNSKNITYQGDFKNDFKHGKGVELVLKRRKNPQPNQQIFIQKSKYEGEFQLGYKQGEGTQITSHGQYKGQWHQGCKHGKGRIQYKNGHVYEGEWANNNFNGQGTYIQAVIFGGQPCENKYTGEFKDGLYHGKGAMQYANGDKYDGEWALGKKQGSGMYEWADSDYYDGQWEKDSAQGTGAACFGGVFYDGQFHFGQKHGLGQQTDADGNTIKAIFQNNKIIKKLEVNGELVQPEDES